MSSDHEARYACIPVALDVYTAIRKKARTRAELAGALAVHERTIRRLLAALGQRIVIDQTRRGTRRGPLEYRIRTRL